MTPAAAHRREAGQLRALARACGVQPAYVDATGRRREAAPDALMAVLRALGRPIERPADAKALAQDENRRRLDRPCRTNLVAWGGTLAFDAMLTRRAATEPISARVLLEDGGVLDCPVEATATQREGEQHVRKRLRARHTRLPEGIHRLLLRIGRREHHATILSAPRRCPAVAQRALGVFAPLYALHSSASWGAGDLRDLEMLASWAAEVGCRYVGVLPLLACYLDHGSDPSPYSPVSRLFLNELFADVTAAPDLRQCPQARRLLSSARFEKEIEELRRGRLVDYRRAIRAKRAILTALAEAVFTSPTRRAELEAWVHANPESSDYARFRAVIKLRAAAWPAWPARMRDGTIREGDYRERDRRMHLYSQWLVATQLDALSRNLEAKSCRLYLDLPIGVHAAGYDVWRYRDHFVGGVEVGAPPDAFFAGGQRWGCPPLHPQTSRRDGHAHFRAVLRHHLRYAGLLRIDHVMGLHRLFWIPDGFEATDGVYVTYPANELYAVLCLEASRHGAVIAGENLGTVPSAVNREMARRGLLRMSVTQLEARPRADRALPTPRSGTLASLNTHDLPPFGGFWTGRDVEIRRSLGLIDASRAARESARRAAIRTAIGTFLRKRRLLTARRPTALEVMRGVLEATSGSAADIMLVNLEDLWLETEPHNVPGAGGRYPSWRRKAGRSLEAILVDRDVRRLLCCLTRSREARPSR